MWPYWLFFIVTARFAIKQRGIVTAMSSVSRRWDIRWRSMFVLLSLFIGFRFEVGCDWRQYGFMVENAATQTWLDIVRSSEPAYGLLNWLASQWGDTYLVNLVCAVLFSWGLISFCKIQPRPWIALVVAVPYLIIVVAMGYTRQGVAIGIVMLALVELQCGRLPRFVGYIAFAALFHKSAVIVVPLAMFAKSRHRWLTITGVLLSTGLLYVLLLKESVEILKISYIEAEYASAGAVIRIAMNALPAAIFLIYRRRFVLMTREQRSFWTWMSLGGLSFVVLLAISPSSTAVDRVALYWIPLQLVVWSHVPDSLGRPLQRNIKWVVAVTGYSAMVLFVWLMFADHSHAWLPYRFYPWEAMWQ